MSRDLMLGPADDYPIHQTAEPIRYCDTSDRRFYDRYFFTGHTCDADLFFLIGLGVYPNLGVIDAFASVASAGAQVATRGSRELGHDRLDMRNVGPFNLEVLDGLKRLRLWTSPGDEAISMDLEWRGTVPAFAEPPLFRRTLGRVVEEGTRFVQTGCWSGWISVDGQRIHLDPARAWGARDRSWGVRSIGLEREPAGIVQAHPESAARTTLWMWSPMQFPDDTVHFAVGEHPDGRREIDTVHQVMSFARGGALAALGGAEHALVFDPATRELQAGSSIGYLAFDGARRTVVLTPLTRAYLRAGTGYGGPDDWRHGKYIGATWSSSLRFDLCDPAVTARIGPTHVLCRMSRDDGAIGYGTFETQVYGAYPRYGFMT